MSNVRHRAMQNAHSKTRIRDIMLQDKQTFNCIVGKFIQNFCRNIILSRGRTGRGKDASAFREYMLCIFMSL